MTTEKNPPSDPFAGKGRVHPHEVGHVAGWDSLAIDLVEGTLPVHVAAPLEAHLAGCPDCRRALAEQRSMATLLEEVSEVTVPPALERAILQASAGFVTSKPGATATRRDTVRDRTPGGTMQSLRRLLNVRVWLPAAAVILVAGIALSSYYRVGLYDGNEAADTLASQSTQQDTADTTAAPFAGAAGEDGALQAPSDGSRESADKAAQATSTTAAGATMMASPASVMIMTVGDAGDEPDTLIQRMKDLTGLEPLPKDSWVEGRITYAALVATAETAALAEDLGVAVTETLPSAEYAAGIPPALAQALGADALTALPLLTPKAGDASSAGRSWLPELDSARRAGDGSDLTIVVITLGAAPLR